MTHAHSLRPWGVLLKVRLPSGAQLASAVTLARLLEALPGEDKKLTGGGRDFTVAWWVEAPDAAVAVEVAGRQLRTSASALGLVELHVIRSHAASVEGRAPTIAALDAKAADLDTWTLDVKVAAPIPGASVDREVLDQVRATLPGAVAVTFHGDVEKFLLDDGSGFTIRMWAHGPSMEAAVTLARDQVRSALDGIGLDAWRLVRLKAWDPRALSGDTFPGAAARETTPNPEFR